MKNINNFLSNLMGYIVQELPILIFIICIISLVFSIITIISFVKSKEENSFWIKLWLGIFISCITFLSVDYFQQQNTLRNEPLLLKNKINISINSIYNNRSKIDITIPLNNQGIVSEAYLLYFKNDDSTVSQIIPLNFNNKNNNQLNTSITLNSINSNFNLTNTIVKLNSNIETLNNDNKLLITNTIQLGLILKDSKGNIIVRYFIVRPSIKTHDLGFYYQAKEEETDQLLSSLYRPCNNKLPSTCINLPVIIENKDNIRQNLQNNSNMFDVSFNFIKNSKVSWQENFDSFCKNIINYGFWKSFQLFSKPHITSTNPKIRIHYYKPIPDEVSKNIDITKNYALKLKNNIN